MSAEQVREKLKLYRASSMSALRNVSASAKAVAVKTRQSVATLFAASPPPPASTNEDGMNSDRPSRNRSAPKLPGFVMGEPSLAKLVLGPQQAVQGRRRSAGSSVTASTSSLHAIASSSKRTSSSARAASDTSRTTMKRWKKEPAQENNNKDRAEFEAFDALKSSKKHEGEGTSQQHQQQPQQPEQPQQSRAAPSPAKRTSTPRTQKASSKLASVEAESTTLARASAAVALHANLEQRMKEEHAEGQAELVRALAVVHREWSCVLMKVISFLPSIAQGDDGKRALASVEALVIGPYQTFSDAFTAALEAGQSSSERVGTTTLAQIPKELATSMEAFRAAVVKKDVAEQAEPLGVSSAVQTDAHELAGRTDESGDVTMAKAHEEGKGEDEGQPMEV